MVDVGKYKPELDRLDYQNVNSFTLDFPIFSCLNEDQTRLLLGSRKIQKYLKDGNLNKCLYLLIFFRLGLPKRR
jgi:hypothetical protein